MVAKVIKASQGYRSALEEFVDSQRPLDDKNPRTYARKALYESLGKIEANTETYLAFQELFNEGAQAKYSEFKVCKDKFLVVQLYDAEDNLLATTYNGKLYPEGYVELPDDQGIIKLADFYESIISGEFEFGNSADKPKTWLQSFTQKLLEAKKKNITTEFKQDLEDNLINSYVIPAGVVGKDFGKFLWHLQKWKKELYTTLNLAYINRYGSFDGGLGPVLWNTLEERIEAARAKEQEDYVIEDIPLTEKLVSFVKQICDVRAAPSKALISTTMMVLAGIFGALSKDKLASADAPDNGPDKDASSRQTAHVELSPNEFTNPQEGIGTNNSGGWYVYITNVSEPDIPLSSIQIDLRDPSGPLYARLKTDGQNVNKQTELSSYHWYVLKNSDTTIPNRFWDYDKEGGEGLTDVTDNADIDTNEFSTLEGCYMSLNDNDANNKLSEGDAVIVFKSVDADSYSIPDIRSGSDLEIVYKSNTIGEVSLYFEMSDNQPPVAKITPESQTISIHPPPIGEGGKASFDGSESFDLDGVVSEYKWDFDISTPEADVISSEPSVEHTYAKGGEYTVSLVVKDNNATWSEPAYATVHVIGATDNTTWKEGDYFIHITDTHVHKYNDRLKDFVSHVNSLDQKPKFVLVSGDLVDWGAGSSGQRNFEQFIQTMNQLNVDWYVVPGNHDARYGAGVTSITIPLEGDMFENYYAHIPSEHDLTIGKANYGEVVVFGINSGWDELNPNTSPFPPEGSGISNEQRRSLEEKLDLLDGELNQKDTSGKRKVIFMHHPTFNKDKNGNDDGIFLHNQDEFTRICKQYGVDVVSAGHTHKGNIKTIDGTKYVISNSLGEDAAFRKITYTEDGLTVEMQQIFEETTTGTVSCPAKITMYDSTGKRVNSEIQELPGAFYSGWEINGDRTETVSAYGTDDYSFEIEGTGNGTVEFSIKQNGEIIFSTDPLSVTDKTKLKFTTLEEKVRVEVDKDGDGKLEKKFDVSDGYLTEDELKGGDKPDEQNRGVLCYIAGGVVAALGPLMALFGWYKQRKKQKQSKEESKSFDDSEE